MTTSPGVAEVLRGVGMALVAGVVLGCGRADDPESGAQEVAAARSAEPESTVLDGRSWRLEEPGPDLRLGSGNIEHRAGGLESADFVSLASGRILARAVVHPGDYETLHCFIELEKLEDQWLPRRVGLYFGWCCGAHWLEQLEGTVTFETPASRRLLGQVRVKGQDPWVSGDRKTFAQDFTVWLDYESAQLRNDLAWWNGVPDLR